jgi:hypothetical protein
MQLLLYFMVRRRIDWKMQFRTSCGCVYRGAAADNGRGSWSTFLAVARQEEKDTRVLCSGVREGQTLVNQITPISRT